MDEAGFATAHLVGNSLGGYLALHLASRGRADTVVALAPAGGWAARDDSFRDTLRQTAQVREATRAAAPHADAIAATAEGRRRATRLIVSSADGIPADLVAHLMRGAAGCDGLPALNAAALRDRWAVDAERIACPVRIVWGTGDRLLPWPAAAARYRADLLPHADWVELDGVGHCPQLEVPLETGELILGLTAPGRSAIDAAPHGRG
ncbi:MAG: alpha/beta fold hydrolase [Thermoleophilia bacterium]